MKSFLKYTISVTVLLVYFVASTGFGLHVCSHEGTSELLILTTKTSCEEIHQGCPCGSNHCEKATHDHNCCKTEMHHLDLDYDITEVQSAPQLFFTENGLNAQICFTSTFSDALKGFKYTEIRHGPDEPPTSQYLPLISQWRL